MENSAFIRSVQTHQPNLALQENDAHQLLTNLSQLLENGMPSVNEDSTESANQFHEFWHGILEAFFKRGNNTIVQVKIGQLDVSLNESAQTIQLKIGSCKVTHWFTTPLHKLQKKLIKDIIINFNNYPEAALDLALNHVLVTALGDDPEITDDAVFFTIDHPEIVTTKLKLVAAYYIFQHDQHYAEAIEQVIDMVIAYREDCLKPMVKTAEAVLLDPKEFPAEWVTGALVFLLNCIDEATSSTLKLAAAKHIFTHYKDYSSDTLEAIMEMILRNQEDCLEPLMKDVEEAVNNADAYCNEAIQGALVFILHCPDIVITSKLRLAVVNLVFQPERKYSFETILKIAEMMIRNSSYFQERSVSDSAEYILCQTKAYCFESIRCAALYIACHYSVRSELFQIAVKHLVENESAYPKYALSHVANRFILGNVDFFKAPNKNQKDFKTFYESIDKEDVLMDYSEQLCTELFSVTGRVLEIEVWDAVLGSFVTQELSVLGLWNDHHYLFALEANEENVSSPTPYKTLAKFILSNMAHEAVTFWIPLKDRVDERTNEGTIIGFLEQVRSS